MAKATENIINRSALNVKKGYFLRVQILKITSPILARGGRFLDDGNYAKDIVEGTMFKVQQIRIAEFINRVVATRRWYESLYLCCFCVPLLCLYLGKGKEANDFIVCQGRGGNTYLRWDCCTFYISSVRIDRDVDGATKYPPSVVAKMDVEGRWLVHYTP